MHSSRQRSLVLVGSLTLTALLLGALFGGGVVWRVASRQLSDPEALRARLKAVSPEGDAPARGGAPPRVRVARAQQKAARSQKPIVGRLVEVRKVTASSEVTGKIIDLPVEEGTPVVGGKTVLARIDDIWCRLAAQRCQAQQTATQAKLDFESAELRRCEQLRHKDASTESEAEEKRAAVLELQAKLAEIQATWQEENERQQRAVMVAPFDGTVVAKHAERGAHVAPGTPIVELVSRGQVDACLMVPEAVVNFLHPGQVLPIRIDPLDEEVTGEVVSITPYGASASRTFPVRVRLDDGAGRLKVGMSVTALIATGPEQQALVVSQDAVLVRPDGATVWVALPGRTEDTFTVQPVPVRIAVRMAREYAVEPETGAGRKLLVAGTRVVIEGAERLMPDQQVRIVTLDGAAGERAGPPAQLATGGP